MEIAEGCIPDQNCPPFPILASVKAVDPAMTDDFGLEVERRSTPRNYTSRRTPPITRSHITGFGNRRFSNGDLRPAESQVNRKCVEYDVGALNDDQSPNIHRSIALGCANKVSVDRNFAIATRSYLNNQRSNPQIGSDSSVSEVAGGSEPPFSGPWGPSPAGGGPGKGGSERMRRQAGGRARRSLIATPDSRKSPSNREQECKPVTQARGRASQRTASPCRPTSSGDPSSGRRPRTAGAGEPLRLWLVARLAISQSRSFALCTLDLRSLRGSYLVDTPGGGDTSQEGMLRCIPADGRMRRLPISIRDMLTCGLDLPRASVSADDAAAAS
ncbi:hypothetical protein THAOC_09535, partial [Thalassiosira oceanica]